MEIRYEYIDAPEGKRRLEEAFDILFTETVRRREEIQHENIPKSA